MARRWGARLNQKDTEGVVEDSIDVPLASLSQKRQHSCHLIRLTLKAPLKMWMFSVWSPRPRNVAAVFVSI
jgi:hypothetical protein